MIHTELRPRPLAARLLAEESGFVGVFPGGPARESALPRQASLLIAKDPWTDLPICGIISFHD